MNTFRFWLLYGLSILFVLAALGCLMLLLGTAHMWVRENKDAQDIAPVTGTMVDTRDARLFVFEGGSVSDPSVVFVHGFGWGALWSEIARAVTERDYHALTVDLPPFGYSQRLGGAENYSIAKQALRMADVIKGMEAKKATVVCHSISCPAALELAILKPDLVKKLVLVAPEMGFSGDAKHPSYAPVHISDNMRRLMSMQFIRTAWLATFVTHPYAIPSQFHRQLYNKQVATAERIEFLRAPLQVKDTTNALATWLEYMMVAKENAYVTDFRNLKYVRQPVLIVWGKNDPMPLWQGEALQKLLPHAELKVFPNAGHMPYLEQMELFTKTLLRFLKDKPLDEK